MGLGTRDTGKDSEQSEKSTFDSRRSQSGLDAPESSGMGSGLTDNQTSQSGADPPDSSGMGDGLTVNRISKSGIDRTDSTGMGSSLTGNRSSGSSPSGPSQTAKGLENPEDHFGMDVPNEGVLQRLRANERMHGSRVQGWVDEGMPTDIMGNTRDMRAFRQRQADRPAEVPTDIERQNAHSVQRSAKAAADTSPAGDTGVPDTVRNVVSSSGQSLDGSIKNSMESRMGESFDDVQIHTGPQAAAACDDIDARAFTVGNHVAFNHGEYDPGSPEGQHVIAHELAHVRQQTGGAVSMLPQEGGLQIDPDPAAEREAEETAERVMQGGELGIQRLADTEVHVQRMRRGREAEMTPQNKRQRLNSQADATGNELNAADQRIRAADDGRQNANNSRDQMTRMINDIGNNGAGGGGGINDILDGSIVQNLRQANLHYQAAQRHQETAETRAAEAQTQWEAYVAARNGNLQNLMRFRGPTHDSAGAKREYNNIKQQKNQATRNQDYEERLAKTNEKRARSKDEIIDPQNRSWFQSKKDIKSNEKLDSTHTQNNLQNAVNTARASHTAEQQRLTDIRTRINNTHDDDLNDETMGQLDDELKQVFRASKEAYRQAVEAEQKQLQAQQMLVEVMDSMRRQLRSERDRSRQRDYLVQEELGQINLNKRIGGHMGDAGLLQFLFSFFANFNKFGDPQAQIAGWHAATLAGQLVGQVTGTRGHFGLNLDRIQGAERMGDNKAAMYSNVSNAVGVGATFSGASKWVIKHATWGAMNWIAVGSSVALGLGSIAIGHLLDMKEEEGKANRTANLRHDYNVPAPDPRGPV